MTTVHGLEVLFSLQNSFLAATQWFKSLHAWHLHMFNFSVLSIPLALYPYTSCWNQGCSHWTLVKLYKMLPASCAISWSNSGCICWSPTLTATLHSFQWYHHQLKPKKKPSGSTHPQDQPLESFLTAVHTRRTGRTGTSVLYCCLKTEKYWKFLLPQLEQLHINSPLWPQMLKYSNCKAYEGCTWTNICSSFLALQWL